MHKYIHWLSIWEPVFYQRTNKGKQKLETFFKLQTKIEIIMITRKMKTNQKDYFIKPVYKTIVIIEDCKKTMTKTKVTAPRNRPITSNLLPFGFLLSAVRCALLTWLLFPFIFWKE